MRCSASRTFSATVSCAAGARRKPTENLLGEVAALTAGDLVVHVDHGIGRFIGLETITAAGAPHDCLELHYAGGDKLYLPVENIELLTRYGGEDAEAQLDKTGRRRLADAQGADEEPHPRDGEGPHRHRRAAPACGRRPSSSPPEGLYDEFCARFPYDETEDQLAAIDAVLDDLASGRPMDRLVCGDVGFGKTEVALRAAFCAAINGKQVAVVVPTTLLARQHYKTFCERFAGLPVKIGAPLAHGRRRRSARDQEGLGRRQGRIVIGTHAVLGKGVSLSRISASSSSTRSSISASATRSG